MTLGLEREIDGNAILRLANAIATDPVTAAIPAWAGDIERNDVGVHHSRDARSKVLESNWVALEMLVDSCGYLTRQWPSAKLLAFSSRAPHRHGAKRRRSARFNQTAEGRRAFSTKPIPAADSLDPCAFHFCDIEDGEGGTIILEALSGDRLPSRYKV